MDRTLVRIPALWLWALPALGAGLGVGAAFVVGPLVDWLVGLVGGAPGALRLAARLPLSWAVPALAVAGALVGLWLDRAWQRENPEVSVDAAAVVVRVGGDGIQLARERVTEVFTDGHDLVLLGGDGVELARHKVDDVLVRPLQEAFERFGYPWRGTRDPYEGDYLLWTDQSPDLDEPTHALLRARRRALADKHPGEAAEALDRLRSSGLAVRDRRGAQQYRVATTRR